MKSLQRRFNAYLRQTTPAQAHIKLWAHAATLMTAGLIVPSLCGIYFRDAGLRENEPYWVWASITVWKIHAGVVAVALVLWLFERPRVVKYLPVEPIDDEEDDEVENR